MYAYIWLTGSVTELQKVTKDEEQTLKQIQKKWRKSALAIKKTNIFMGSVNIITSQEDENNCFTQQWYSQMA